MERTAESIICELDRIFVEQFELEPGMVVPEARLREDLDLDSLDAADMLIAIEKRMGVRLDDQVARGFRTVADIHGYVHQLLQEKAAANVQSSGEQAAG